jgi:6-phosphogluconolactonase
VYAVNEIGNYEGTTSGSVTAYAIDPATGNLNFLNRQSTYGPIPAHLTVDATNRYLLVANYNGGNVVAYPIGPDGRLGDASDMAQHMCLTVARTGRWPAQN